MRRREHPRGWLQGAAPPALPPLSLHVIVLTPLEVVVSLLTRCSGDDGAFLAAWGQAVGGGKMGLVGAKCRAGRGKSARRNASLRAAASPAPRADLVLQEPPLFGSETLLSWLQEDAQPPGLYFGSGINI